jgi:hypothetical protein
MARSSIQIGLSKSVKNDDAQAVKPRMKLRGGCSVGGGRVADLGGGVERG